MKRYSFFISLDPFLCFLNTTVGFPIGHAVIQLSGYADMQGCGYAARRYMVIGHMALWFVAIRHLVGCCFYILCR